MAQLTLISPVKDTENVQAVYGTEPLAAKYVENTLAGELLRIKAYIAEIGREAAFLALKASGANVSETSTLDQIAAAMLSIVKHTAADASGAVVFEEDGTTVKTEKVGEIDIPVGYLKDSAKEELTLDAGESTILPAGYYINPVTVKTSSLSSQSVGTATALDILKGATAWVNGTKITGTLDTDLSEKIAGNDAYKANDGKLVIYLNEDSLNSDNNRTVDTGIAYNPNVVSEIYIQKVTTEDNESAYTVQSVEIPAGYYPTKQNVPVYIEDASGNKEKQLNVKAIDVTGNQDFGTDETKVYTPGEKFDYLTKVTVDKAKVTTNNVTGKFTIDKAGWINTNEGFAGLDEGSYAENGTVTPKTDGATVTITKKDHGYTPDEVVVNIAAVSNPSNQEEVTVTADKNAGTASFETTVDIAAGYHNAGTVTVKGSVDLTTISGAHTVTMDAPATAEDKATYVNVVSSLYFTDDLQHGYFKADDTKKYKVLNAVLVSPPEVKKASATDSGKAELTIPVSTKGWFEGATYELEAKGIKDLVDGLTTVETLSYNSVNTATSINIANANGAVVDSIEGSYYNLVDMSGLLNLMKSV